MLLRVFTIVLIVSTTSTSIAQSKNYITIGAGYDLLSFKGELNHNQKFNELNSFRSGYGFFIEKRFGSLIGLSGNAMFGKISQYENSSARRLYFQSQVSQIDFRVSLYFDNKFLLGSDARFSPFLSAGIGYLKFDPYGDLADDNNNIYYYWADGSLMDQAETDDNKLTANVIQRDYKYETQLTDPSEDYLRSALAIPVLFGVNCKLTDNIKMRVSRTYSFTNSDWIDNTSEDNKNDRIISTNFSLTYTIGKKESENNYFENTNFTEIIEEDHDQDGVKDIIDMCQHTPKDAFVDERGCPLDKDQDGVPDFRDKEENTSDSVHVNKDGITITDEDFLQKFMQRDSTEIASIILKTHHITNLEEMKDIDVKIDKHTRSGNHITIPVELLFADFNEDGVIHSEEAIKCLDKFLDGELNITINQLHNLIDFFFEQ